MKKTDPAVAQQIIELRRTGMTREQIQAQTGYTMGRIKNVLLKNQVILPMEQQQANAYAGKLAKNPNAMAEMRKTLTPEVVQRRSESIRTTYEDPVLRDLKQQQSKAWWNSMSEQDRLAHIQDRALASDASAIAQAYRAFLKTQTGVDNAKSKVTLERYGIQNFDQLMTIYADRRGGKYLGGYMHSLAKCQWSCKQGHEWDMKPNKVQQGQWCPVCARKFSKSEDDLRTWIRSFYPDTEGPVRGLLESKRFELDIWVPSIRKAIEFDGDFWHDTEEARKRDLRKNKQCATAGIGLYRVRYSDWVADSDTVKAQVLAYLR